MALLECFLNVIIILYCLYDAGLKLPVTANPQKKEKLILNTNYCCVNLFYKGIYYIGFYMKNWEQS